MDQHLALFRSARLKLAQAEVRVRGAGLRAALPPNLARRNHVE